MMMSVSNKKQNQEQVFNFECRSKMYSTATRLARIWWRSYTSLRSDGVAMEHAYQLADDHRVAVLTRYASILKAERDKARGRSQRCRHVLLCLTLCPWQCIAMTTNSSGYCGKHEGGRN